jgi:hypothetical protein
MSIKRILGQDDWLVYARRDDDVLVYTVIETTGLWFDTPHEGDCWDEATGRNCDGETKFVCRKDSTWMHEYIKAHPDKFCWEECGYDTDGTYLGWPPEKDEAFIASSRRTYLID